MSTSEAWRKKTCGQIVNPAIGGNDGVASRCGFCCPMGCPGSGTCSGLTHNDRFPRCTKGNLGAAGVCRALVVSWVCCVVLNHRPSLTSETLGCRPCFRFRSGTRDPDLEGRWKRCVNGSQCCAQGRSRRGETLFGGPVLSEQPLLESGLPRIAPAWAGRPANQGWTTPATCRCSASVGRETPGRSGDSDMRVSRGYGVCRIAQGHISVTSQ
jgi:hypothetical protein